MSKVPAGQLFLDSLGFDAPLLCDMCLGEGTGAVTLFPLLDMADAVSSNDCTGLLTHGTGLEEELDYYSQLYKFGTSPDE